jgi:hypothetical protein
MLVLFPAFGGDYRKVSEVAAAWRADATFVLAVSGRYVSRSQLLARGVPWSQVEVRYFRRKRVVSVVWFEEGSGPRGGSGGG